MSDAEDASHLVGSGDAVAFVRVFVGGGPAAPGAAGTDLISVENPELLAGKLSNGPLVQVQVIPSENGSALPEGRYLLLLGVAPEAKSTYYLADGTPGSFVDEGQSAYQRCPNYSDPANPLVVRDGVVDEAQVVNLFSEALAKKDAEPSAG